MKRSTPEPQRGLTLAAKGGHNGESHNHNDVGSFIVAVDGVPAVADAGRPTYTAQTFGPDRYGKTVTKMVRDLHKGDHPEAAVLLMRFEGEPAGIVALEDVTLEREVAPGASARNHLHGRIVALEPEGPLERVKLDCGFPLAALITRNAREDLALKPGDAIVASVKATTIHVVPRA